MKALGVDIIGFTLIDVPPFDVVHLMLTDEPTVLYGANGAGKTRLLCTIRDALAGVAPKGGTVLVHAQVDQQLQWSELESWSVSGGVIDELMEREYSPGLMTVSSFFSICDIYPRFLDGDRLDNEFRFEKFWASNRDAPRASATVRPVGDDKRPRWTMSPAVPVWTPLPPLPSVEPYVDAFLSHLEPKDFDFLSPGDSKEELREALLRNPEKIFEVFGVRKDSEEEHLRERLRDVGDFFVDQNSPLSVRVYGEVLRKPEGWPGWATVPSRDIAYRGSEMDAESAASEFLSPVVMLDESFQDLDDTTQRWSNRPSAPFMPGDSRPDSEREFSGDQLLQGVEVRANELFCTVMPRCGRLSFPEPDLDGLLAGTARPQWKLNERPLTEVSWVESRWAAAAIRVGLDEMRRRMTRSDERLFLLDEPERGLHRSAEIRVGDFIAKLQKTGSRVLVASHSPALLNDARLARVHVQRDDITGKSRLNPLRLPVSGDIVFRRFAAEQLGLTTADVLQLIRVFVFVEGQHDRAVIGNLLESALAESFARVLPMGGAKEMNKSLQAEFIFEDTDARIIVVLDNLSEAKQFWEQFKTAAGAGDERGADNAIRRLSQLRTGEATWLTEFALAAQRDGQLHRISVVGLTQPDIICYLDPAYFELPADAEWSTLVGDWKRSARNAVDFKGWLRTNHEAKINLGRVEKAAAAAAGSNAHPDFVGLEMAIREAATFKTELP